MHILRSCFFALRNVLRFFLFFCPLKRQLSAAIFLGVWFCFLLLPWATPSSTPWNNIRAVSGICGGCKTVQKCSCYPKNRKEIPKNLRKEQMILPQSVASPEPEKLLEKFLFPWWNLMKCSPEFLCPQIVIKVGMHQTLILGGFAIEISVKILVKSQNWDR